MLFLHLLTTVEVRDLPLNNGVQGLINGTTFSVSINGRKNKGPGGAGSSAISFVPRLAGNTGTWGVADTVSFVGKVMHGISNGTATVAGVVTSNVYMAVGDSDSIFSSTDGISWSAVSPSPTVSVSGTLNAVISYGTTYLAVGAGGVILKTPDGITWTQQSIGVTGSALNAIASNGAAINSGAVFVAVGANGTIINSGDGATWSAATTNPVAGGTILYGVTYANSRYVAVGSGGIVLSSPDGYTWTNVTPAGSTSDLKSIAYGGVTSSGVNTGAYNFATVGAAGTLVTSIDGGASWQLHWCS